MGLGVGTQTQARYL